MDIEKRSKNEAIPGKIDLDKLSTDEEMLEWFDGLASRTPFSFKEDFPQYLSEATNVEVKAFTTSERTQRVYRTPSLPSDIDPRAEFGSIIVRDGEEWVVVENTIGTGEEWEAIRVARLKSLKSHFRGRI